jgi:hypothetical protein
MWIKSLKLKASADPDSFLSKGGGSALSTINPTQTGTIQQPATHLPEMKIHSLNS